MDTLTKENLSFVYDFYKDMVPHNLTYVYRGNFSRSLNEGILSLSESNLNNISEDAKVRKKVYFIMVESLQNITRHEDKVEDENSETSSFFVIQRQDNSHLVTSGNIIENKNIDGLKGKLEKVNSLDPESLKDYAREIMKHGGFSEKGGAGLGLIEMARKSGNKLTYDFVKINDTISYFYFQTRISGENQPAVPKNYFEEAKGYHQLLIGKNLNLVYQGQFSQENLKSILGMIEASISTKGGLPVRKKIFNVLVEALQNIFKHGKNMGNAEEEKNGIFIIGNSDGEYRLATGNVVSNSIIADLKTKLELVNSSSIDQLNDLYNSIISSDEVSGENGAGLGLIDMKLKSEQNLIYNFTPIDNENSFYSLQITIKDTPSLMPN
jgi:hypothetical protein